MSRALKLDRRGKLRLTEADVTKQCIDFLLAEGWTCKRQHVGRFVAVSEWESQAPNVVTIGEKGDPDWLILKKPRGWLGDAPEFWFGFYFEVKAPGGRLRPAQKLKHAALRKDGWLVCVASGLDGLRGWMTEHGLGRKPS